MGTVKLDNVYCMCNVTESLTHTFMLLNRLWVAMLKNIPIICSHRRVIRFLTVFNIFASLNCEMKLVIIIKCRVIKGMFFFYCKPKRTGNLFGISY